MTELTHVILCGGSGTRLWPLSNSSQPKQLLRIFHDKSLLQLTAERNLGLSERTIAVASDKLADEIESQLSECRGKDSIQIIKEPAARNTAAAIALAALMCDSNEVLLVTPSDHLIGTQGLYTDAIMQALHLATDNALVTFGLKPLYAETGFGYIHHSGHEVIRFMEKPSRSLAEEFFTSGEYLWNSGIFCFKAGIFLAELRLYAPGIYEKAFEAAEEYIRTGEISLETMLAIPSNSIDYAVMERSGRVKVVPTTMKWSDVGSYDSLSDALMQEYNHQNDAAVYIESDRSASIVIGNAKLVALVGVEDLVVVNTDKAILVMKKGHGQNIKQLHQWVKENRPDLV